MNLKLSKFNNFLINKFHIMRNNLFLIISIAIMCGCSSSKIKTYSDPNLSISNINSIAILPLRNSFTATNTSLSTSDIIELNKMFQQEFMQKNPTLKILNSVESSDILNEMDLVEEYDKLLQVYGSTGIPNTKILQNIGEKLKIDAITQGFLTKVVQNDGSYGRVNAETTIKAKYVMFSTKTGAVLWEIIVDGSKIGSTIAKAPPVEDVMGILRKKISTSIPKIE
jgi:hypothetical protein